MVEAGFAAANRKETVNILGAAVGMLRMSPWVETPKAERDALIFEAVKLAVDNGADLNTLNTDGHTPLDAAKTLGIKPVIDYLTEKGAKPGTTPPQTPGRGRGR